MDAPRQGGDSLPPDALAIQLPSSSLEYITEIQSIAQAGLFYGKDVYDHERYERLREIAAEMMALKTELPLHTGRNTGQHSLIERKFR